MYGGNRARHGGAGVEVDARQHHAHAAATHRT